MSIVSIETAMHHLRADADDMLDVYHKLDGAQEIAEQFIGRRIYTNYPEVLATASSALADMKALMAEKEIILGSDIETSLKDMQLERITSEWHNMLMAARCIATNGAIEIAILLILGTLYEHREDVVIGTSIVKLPQAAEHRLQPYRVMGV
jgi:hypothetical protein